MTLASAPALSSVRCWATVCRLKIGSAKIVERVVAGIVVIRVAPHEAGEIEDGVVADGVGPGGRYVKGQDLGALIGRTQWDAGQRVQVEGAIDIVKLLVVGVGSLKPGAGELKVQVKRVRAGKLRSRHGRTRSLRCRGHAKPVNSGPSRKRPVFSPLMAIKFPQFLPP